VKRSLSLAERHRVYVILKLTVEALADGGLKISGAFGKESPVWEDVGTSRRSSSSANPPRLEFALVSRGDKVEATFRLRSR
jgi:hypothetical protein